VINAISKNNNDISKSADAIGHGAVVGGVMNDCSIIQLLEERVGAEYRQCKEWDESTNIYKAAKHLVEPSEATRETARQQKLRSVESAEGRALSLGVEDANRGFEINNFQTLEDTNLRATFQEFMGNGVHHEEGNEGQNILRRMWRDKVTRTYVGQRMMKSINFFSKAHDRQAASAVREHPENAADNFTFIPREHGNPETHTSSNVRFEEPNRTDVAEYLMFIPSERRLDDPILGTHRILMPKGNFLADE